MRKYREQEEGRTRAGAKVCMEHCIYSTAISNNDFQHVMSFNFDDSYFCKLHSVLL